MKHSIPNILAERYASAAMTAIWSPEGKIRRERELWIAIMKAQRDLGLDIPEEAIAAYQNVVARIDLESIDARERITRHDVKARIDEFCALAGYEHIHKGMTSRDLTENVEQLQVRESLGLARERLAAVLVRLAARAVEFRDLVISARTHNVAAQPTTLGKRIAMFGEEILLGYRRIDELYRRYPVRGLKGAVGTQLDQLTLFDGQQARVSDLEKSLLRHLGISDVLGAVGQVYPRSLDYDTVSALVQAASGLSSFAHTLRIMAGNETASEGFARGQVGSSAMPHKMNSRSSERINGFHKILRGYATMVEALAGDQWNEGDVSCSVVRRVALPDSFLCFDGMIETFLTILEQMEAFPALIDRENRRYFPFLSTTTILMQAVKKGAGREAAHEAIKEHAVAAVLELRSGEVEQNPLLDKLASDTRLGLSRAELQQIIDNAAELTGTAGRQVDSFAAAVAALAAEHPGAESYRPQSIL